MVELNGPTITLDLYETVEDLLKSGKEGAALIYDGKLKKRHKASLFRIICRHRDEENWIPFSQFDIQEKSRTNPDMAKLQITKWLFDQRKQASPMGIKR